MVTVWGAFQLVVVKLNGTGGAVPSLLFGRSYDLVTVFEPVGCDVSTTVNCAVARSSPVVESGTVTVKPAESLSTLDIDTLPGRIAAYAASLLVVASKMMV